jgi:hypothetical protein
MTDFLDDTGEIPRPESAVPPPPGPGDRPPARMPVPARRTPFASMQAVGIARSVNMRSETFGQGASRQILTFRLEQYDDHGNRQTPIPVEMRVLSVRGQLSEGEEVMVRGRWRHGLLRVRRIHNLTTGAVITAPLRSRSFKWMVWPVGLAVLIAVGAVVAGIVRDGSDSIGSANPLGNGLTAPLPSVPTGGGSGGGESGSGGGTTPSTEPAPPPTVAPMPSPPAGAEVVIDIGDHRLDPQHVALSAGDDIVFMNHDLADHSPMIDGAGYDAPSRAASDLIRPTLVPGTTYEVYCGIHGDRLGTLELA